MLGLAPSMLGGRGGDSLWGKIKIEGTGKRKDKVEGKKEEMHKNNVRKCLKIAFFLLRLPAASMYAGKKTYLEGWWEGV